MSTDAITRMNYRPEIDGLRAIAVLSVMLYHFQLPAVSVPGGYTGVDVFFVISGYLITRILVANAGTHEALKTFYLRRFRRIYPALLAVIAVSLVVGYFILVPGDYADLGGSSRFSIFALSNLYFYGNTGYFDQAAELQPLLHTWSLAVEEQFYFIWPLVVFVGFRAGGRRGVAAACFIIVVLSFLYSAWMVTLDAKQAFYDPLARAWELSLGALVVFLPAMNWHKVAAELVDWMGIALIGYSCFGLSDASSFPGPNALYACAGSALLIWPKAAQTSVARCLAVGPMRGVGVISYSLYLWHWPILVFGLHYFGEAIPPIAAANLFVLVFAVALLSWRFIEQPFRMRVFSMQMGKLTSAGALMMLTVVSTAVMVSHGVTSRLPASAVPISDLDVMRDWDVQDRSFDPFTKELVFGAPWKDADYRIVIWGDSHAQHMAPLVEATVLQNAHRLGVSVLMYHACPAIVDGNDVYTYRHDAQYNRRCAEDRKTLWAFLGANEGTVDRVVLASSWRNVVAGLTPDSNMEQGLKKFRATLRVVVDELLRNVPEVTLIGQVPSWARNPLPCAFARLANFPRHSCPDDLPVLPVAQLDEYSFRVNGVMDEIAEQRPRVTAIDPIAHWCTDSFCQSVIDGHFLYRDSGHLRRNLPVHVRSELAWQLGLGSLLPPDMPAYPVLESEVSAR